MASTADATLFCLTPCKDEAWILDQTIAAASTWADYVIVADQRSTDGSREIIEQHEKAVLVDNPGEKWDEKQRQHLLINTARQLPASGKRILIALDADEALSANWMESPEWQRILAAPPGTVFGFLWANLMPDFQTAWVPRDDKKWFCVVDEGQPHDPILIHGPRIPFDEDAPRHLLHDIKVLHYQFADWERMRSKQRWYQSWEHLTFPEKSSVDIFRQYNHMYGILEHELQPVEERWFIGYEQRGIDMRSVYTEGRYRWDAEVLDMIATHGADRLKRAAIWDDADWQGLAQTYTMPHPPQVFADPRTAWERLIHRFLLASQARRHAFDIRAVHYALKLLGW